MLQNVIAGVAGNIEGATLKHISRKLSGRKHVADITKGLRVVIQIPLKS